jgi:hypothetical protein
VDELAGGDGAFDPVEEADELLVAMARAMHWPITVPSRTLSAANSLVVLCRM